MKKQDFKVLKTKDLYPFPDNPFHVAEDETLSELAESIKEFGIVTPIITRPKHVIQMVKEYGGIEYEINLSEKEKGWYYVTAKVGE